MSAVNPRYVAYARAHGKTPDEMLAVDQDRWPGGCMCGFMFWIQHRWRLWRSENGIPMDAPVWGDHHRQFDAWLENRHATGVETTEDR